MFLGKKTGDGKSIDTIAKLIDAALSISSGPSLTQYIDVIKEHQKIKNTTSLASQGVFALSNEQKQQIKKNWAIKQIDALLKNQQYINECFNTLSDRKIKSAPQVFSNHAIDRAIDTLVKSIENFTSIELIDNFNFLEDDELFKYTVVQELYYGEYDKDADSRPTQEAVP